MPNIVSASRRTDIPQFYGDWFAARRKAGHCESRNVFGRPYRVSLKDDDVLAYLFWTKNTAPFEGRLGSLLDEGLPVAVQFTITGYGPSLERNIPPLSTTVPAFCRASSLLAGPGAIQWRYDPIVLSESFGPDWHRRNFREIASRLSGAARVCNASFVEPYAKVVRRMGPGVAYRAARGGRRMTLPRGRADLREIGVEGARLAQDLATVAREYGIELRGCCSAELPLPPAQCCGAELFEDYGIMSKLADVPVAPSRPACRCLRVLDIGMDDSCPGGCRYCYVTDAAKTAEDNYRRRDVNAVRMR